ncbi:sigma-70 family RNA polymerase sigma factor [Actinomadura barringtoniae]|uniref:Sigma-70 family RNA polymerase sigma factor n=1 Tax=Actinomadura barringtoniae TaxID=1427535 RepID=A0A939TEK2_9ACTN|nr:sigma-70 family RNA polymerase sigma factor [Actinomadura barringtoniae]MBO2453445.1 sigma-70 family RNA polymerase sigma factor [Actinomadura barringtoniae]
MTADTATSFSTDAEEIARSSREPERFAVLFDRHGARLHRYAARRLGDGEADDIVAETFLVAFRQRDGYDLGRSDALPWLYGIASNLIRRHRRAEVSRYRTFVRTGVLMDAAEGVAERAVERASAEMSGRRLADAIAKLPARDRDVLLLVAWADLTYEQVADALGLPVGTVRSRLNRARTKVKQALGGVNPVSDHDSKENNDERPA